MSAVISACGLFRYRLDREVSLLGGNVIAFFGVNPSTAGATAEDQTTRKWRGFAERAGAARYIAGNAFALRSTDVGGLSLAPDPVGPENDRHLAEIMAEADILVPCWGARAKLPPALQPHLDRLTDLLFASGKPVRVLGLTTAGDPLHPLTLSYDRPLVAWAR